nr:protein-L-isoaspartate O-methyltransferase [Alteraurantiacibacter buctensis]
MLDSPVKTDNHAAARKAMVDSQLRTSGVTALWAVGPMGRVPRESYVPESARAVAYMDRAVPLGDGKWLAAPLVHGLLLQEAAPQADDVAIVVDGGSGYLAELLRGQVASVEVLSPEQALTTKGKAKASLIVIDGAVEQVPAALAARLADDGRLVTGLADKGVTSVARGRKAGGNVALLKLIEVGMPRLAQFDVPKGWTF